MITLTEENLRTLVPSAYAEGPADTVSDRYSFINTRSVIDRLADRGWFPVRASQSTKVHDLLHTTHNITFRKSDERIKVGDVSPEISVTNNHAAFKRAIMRAGFYRWACTNGLVVAVPGLPDARFSVIHIDDAAFDFDLSFETALSQMEAATAQIEKWIHTPMNFIERNDFAAKAILLRNHEDTIWSKHFDAHEFLTIRRPADMQNNLWTIFNVVQENIIKGGVMGNARKTRPITQVSEVQRINEGLWELATQYGQSLN